MSKNSFNKKPNLRSTLNDNLKFKYDCPEIRYPGIEFIKCNKKLRLILALIR